MSRPVARTLSLGAAVLGAFFVLASCQNPFNTSDYRDRLAVVDTVIAPDSVFALQTFKVTLRTEAPNSCWSKGHDDAEPQAGGMLVTPYDQEYTGKNACAQAIVHFQHELTIYAPSKGTFTLTVKTRTRSVSGADSTAVVTRTILLQ